MFQRIGSSQTRHALTHATHLSIPPPDPQCWLPQFLAYLTMHPAPPAGLPAVTDQVVWSGAD